MEIHQARNFVIKPQFEVKFFSGPADSIHNDNFLPSCYRQLLRETRIKSGLSGREYAEMFSHSGSQNPGDILI